MDSVKIARFESDYSPGTFLRIVRMPDGDISVGIYGDDEFKIAANGGQLHGKNLVEIVNLFTKIIDAFNNIEEATNG
jgi:hypothetical protein